MRSDSIGFGRYPIDVALIKGDLMYVGLGTLLVIVIILLIIYIF